MMVTTTETRFTRDDYMLLPEGFRAELIDGMLVKDPAPTGWHQVIVMRIGLALANIVGTRRAVVSPIDVSVDDWNVVQPDVLVLPEDCPISPGDAQVGTPALVVEVLSPSTASRDRDQKVAIYLRAGVKEVWLVDPESESAEVHTAEGVERFEPGSTPASRTVPGFGLSLESLFGA
jgi:Uma2 family endonuclease